MKTPTTSMLTPEDHVELAILESLRDLIRSRVRGVAERYQIGTYIYGRPGSSKTHTVIETLESLDSPYRLFNCRMSGPGLYDLFRDHPEHVIVLDDINSLFKQKGALSVLLGALGGEPGRPRRITYQVRGKGKESCDFSGGVVAISNLPLRRDPETDAVASRMAKLPYETTDAMLIALAKSLALKGFEDLTPDECMDVVKFVVVESRNMDLRIDLRTVVKAWQDRRLDKHGRSLRPWEDLVRSSMDRAVPEPRSRAERVEWQRQIARQMFDKYPHDRASRGREWQALTNSSVDTLYRRYRGD